MDATSVVGAKADGSEEVKPELMVRLHEFVVGADSTSNGN